MLDLPQPPSPQMVIVMREGSSVDERREETAAEIWRASETSQDRSGE